MGLMSLVSCCLEMPISSARADMVSSLPGNTCRVNSTSKARECSLISASGARGFFDMAKKSIRN